MVTFRKFLSRSLILVAVAVVPVSQALAQECRDSRLYDSQTGKLIIDPATGEPRRCSGNENGIGNNALLGLGGAALVAGGTIGGLAASGAFDGGGSGGPVIIPPAAPISRQ